MTTAHLTPNELAQRWLDKLAASQGYPPSKEQILRYADRYEAAARELRALALTRTVDAPALDPDEAPAESSMAATPPPAKRRGRPAGSGRPGATETTARPPAAPKPPPAQRSETLVVPRGGKRPRPGDGRPVSPAMLSSMPLAAAVTTPRRVPPPEEILGRVPPRIAAARALTGNTTPKPDPSDP